MKKTLAIILIIVMALGLLVGCGGGNAGGNQGGAPAAGGDAPAAGGEQPGVGGGEEAPGVFKIGGIGPLTGGAAIYGNAAKNGATIAAEEINALGGIQIDLRYEDDAHDAEKSVNAYNTLKDWGMQAFLGSVTSTPCVATSQEAQADHVFLLTPSASATNVLGGVADPLTGAVDVERKPVVFQMCFTDPNQGSASAQYIVDKQLGSKIAVIYKNDDVYSTGIYNSFKKQADVLGLDIVSTTTFTEDTQTDFSVQISDAKANGADFLFLPMYYQPASLILAQCAGIGYAPTFFGVDGMDGILTMDGFNTELAEGVMLLTPFNADSSDPRTQNFVGTYQAKYGEIPNQFAADGYDCVYAIYEALMAGGATPDMSASQLCDLLIGQFTSMSFDGLTGDGMSWGVDGAVTKSPKGMVIQNGAYVGMD